MFITAVHKLLLVGLDWSKCVLITVSSHATWRFGVECKLLQRQSVFGTGWTKAYQHLPYLAHISSTLCSFTKMASPFSTPRTSACLYQDGVFSAVPIFFFNPESVNAVSSCCLATLCMVDQLNGIVSVGLLHIL